MWLAAETGDHAFVDLARDAHVVEIVFADQIELAGLVKIEDLAAFDVGSLARFDTQRPRDVVKTDVSPRAQPPAMHRVEDAAHVIVAEIHEWACLERVRQAALKDERQIETDNVMTDELIAIRIEILHQV